MAPERQDDTQRPQPLQSAELISDLPANLPSSMKDGAEYGQTEMQIPQLLQLIKSMTAISPFVVTVPWASNVTALEAAAIPWATDSSIGFG